MLEVLNSNNKFQSYKPDESDETYLIDVWKN